ncbi:MAG: ATP-binding protein [Gammaproteobacteria bacterium]|nr:ATP-binding protein [Gammaproteobacteria bacterium]
MRLPDRPETIQALEQRIASGDLRESRVLEFKREFPTNKALAKQVAALSTEGGVLVIGVAEMESGLRVTPVDCSGARERVEQVARDIPEPPVQVVSHVLEGDKPRRGVLWIEITASPAMLHQVDGTYYERGDTQKRPMRDSDVADRMRLRGERPRQIQQALEDALRRERPAAPSQHARTCVVARPIGSPDNEFFERSREHETWDSFAFDLTTPPGPLPAVPHRYWGLISHLVVPAWQTIRSPGELSMYRDIEFQESGAFSYLSYSQDWLRGRGDGIFPLSALRACWEAISIVGAVQRHTGQRRAWDLAFSICQVKGRKGRPRKPEPALSRFLPDLPRDAYSGRLLGVGTDRLEEDAKGVVAALAARFIAECGLDFDEEWQGSG